MKRFALARNFVCRLSALRTLLQCGKSADNSAKRRFSEALPRVDCVANMREAKTLGKTLPIDAGAWTE